MGVGNLHTPHIAEVKRFWDAWYVPNNAVIGIVGDVDFDHLKNIVTKYFGDIPARPLPARVSTVEPPQAGERRITVEFDANPTFIMGFHKPTWPDRDDVVLSVIQGVLSSGRTSRFDKVIVRKNKIALSVDTWGAPGSRYPNVFAISGEPRPPHTTLDVETAVWEELEKLKEKPVTEAELSRVKTNMDASFIRGMVSHYGMAHLLTHYEQVTGDWRNVEVERDMTNSVTAEDIMRVAKKYFTKDNVNRGYAGKKEKMNRATLKFLAALLIVITGHACATDGTPKISASGKSYKDLVYPPIKTDIPKPLRANAFQWHESFTDARP